MIRSLLAFACICLSACTVPQQAQVSRAAVASDTLPAMRRFDGTQARPVPMPSNTQLANDFLELSFELESGRVLPTFTRFEGPVTVAVAAGAPATLSRDLDDLLIRLRREARIPIQRAPRGAPASITIVSLPGNELRRVVPQAACFVAANVSSWEEYLAQRGRTTDWASLEAREKVAVFLPVDASPQDVRDCLHEEIAQALGPLNDLYRLPWSIFNDDNLQVVLTSYDMAILRVTYHPKLNSGMSRAEVAAVLPLILRELFPRRTTSDQAVITSDDALDDALNRAIAAASSSTARIRAARKAVRLAKQRGYQDVRLGMAYLAQATALADSQPQTAIASFITAREAFKSVYGFESHTAQATVHPAAFAVANGRFDVAEAITGASIPAARRAQNAALLSSLLLVRAAALEGLGRQDEAARIRHEAKAYALYGYGSEVIVRDRVAQVAALTPSP